MYDFATGPLLNFPIYEENLIFFFYQCRRKKGMGKVRGGDECNAVINTVLHLAEEELGVKSRNRWSSPAVV